MPGTRKLPPVKRVALLYGQRPYSKRPHPKRLCHNYYQQNHDLSDSSVTNYFLNLGVKPLRKLALKVPVLNCDTASKRVALFLRPKAVQQMTTPKGGGFVLPGRVKQSRHEVSMVFFCDPVQSTGV